MTSQYKPRDCVSRTGVEIRCDGRCVSVVFAIEATRAKTAWAARRLGGYSRNSGSAEKAFSTKPHAFNDTPANELSTALSGSTLQRGC